LRIANALNEGTGGRNLPPVLLFGALGELSEKKFHAKTQRRKETTEGNLRKSASSAVKTVFKIPVNLRKSADRKT
jgi:hypothetical protein